MRIQQGNANKKPNGHFNLTLHNGTEISSTCGEAVAGLDKISDHWIVSEQGFTHYVCITRGVSDVPEICI